MQAHLHARGRHLYGMQKEAYKRKRLPGKVARKMVFWKSKAANAGFIRVCIKWKFQATNGPPELTLHRRDWMTFETMLTFSRVLFRVYSLSRPLSYSRTHKPAACVRAPPSFATLLARFFTGFARALELSSRNHPEVRAATPRRFVSFLDFAALISLLDFLQPI